MLFGLEEVFWDQIKISDRMWPIASKNMKNMDLQFADIIQFSEMACEKIIKNNFNTL